MAKSESWNSQYLPCLLAQFAASAAFNQCLDSGEMKAEIDKDTKEGSTYGVTGTPASFVNGRFLSGAQPYDAFKKVIDDELMMKGIAVPTAQATTPVADTTTVKR